MQSCLWRSLAHAVMSLAESCPCSHVFGGVLPMQSCLWRSLAHAAMSLAESCPCSHVFGGVLPSQARRNTSRQQQSQAKSDSQLRRRVTLCQKMKGENEVE